VKALQIKAKNIAKRRRAKINLATRAGKLPPCRAIKNLTQIFSQCVAQRGFEVLKLPSGAGHDGAALSKICPVADVIVRLKKGSAIILTSQ